MTNTIISVSNAAELKTAISNLKGGETIELAAGDYGELRLQNIFDNNLIDLPEDVTIRSADPDDQANFDYLMVRGVQNIIIEDVTFDYTYKEGDQDNSQPFTVYDATGIEIHNCTFDGDLAQTDDPMTDGYGIARGLMVRNSADIVIEDSSFTQWARGLLVDTVDNIVVSGNDFYENRMDGANFSAVQGVLIEENTFRDFMIARDSPDHCDMIQFWTNGTTRPSTDVVIQNNLFDIGEGGETQTIFMRNEVVDKGQAGEDMFYKNFTITENVIINAQANAIVVGQVDGLNISNNTLLRNPGENDLPDLPIYTPSIRVVEDAVNVSIVQNVTSDITGYTGQETWTLENNVLVQDSYTNTPGHYGEMFINSDGDMGDLSNLQARADSPVALYQAGASVLQYNPAPDALTALVTSEQSENAWSVFRLDAGYSAGPDGALPEGTVYLWDFGDGTSGSGQVATHSYGEVGTYTATLTVIQPDGQTDVTWTTVNTGQPEVVGFDSDTGSFVLANHANIEVAPEFIKDGALLFDDVNDTLSIDKSKIATLFDAETFNVSMSLRADDWSTDAGHVARVHQSFSLEVGTDGLVTARLYLEDQGQVVRTADTALSDGDWNDVVLSFDNDTGTLAMSIDGEDVGMVEVSGNLPSMKAWGLTFGAAYGRDSFTGEIASFELSANTEKYPEFIEETLNIPAVDAGSDIFDMIINGSDLISFVGDVTETADSGSLRFDGEGDMLALDKSLDTTLGEQLSVSLEYSRDEADGAYARLVWGHMKFGVEISGDDLGVRIATEDQGFKLFKVKDLGLNDTETHRIKVAADENTDVLEIYLDDVLVFRDDTTDLAFSGNEDDYVWGWTVGGAFGHDLDGEIYDLQISDSLDSSEIVAPMENADLFL